MNVREILKDFIRNEIYDLQEEGNLCLEYCENEGDYHLVSYWIDGTYDNVRYFLKNNYSEALSEVIYDLYPNEKNALVLKIKAVYGECNEDYLLREALATILLKEMQEYPQWYTVYGSEEEDMIDFNNYEIINALKNKEDFPVMKREDIVAAMYGVNTKVQPSEMYDVFAHYADELSNNNSLLKEENTFTPDLFQVGAVVSRYKQYSDVVRKLSSDYAFEFANLFNIPEELRPEYILNSAIYDYKNRYSEAPYGLPLHDNMIHGEVISMENCNKYKITYSIRGVKAKTVCWDKISEQIYDIPETAEEYQGLICNIAIDFKRELNGLEKVRNKDIAAVSGKYPNRLSASHGLTFAKDLNTHKKDARGHDYKKEAKLNYSLSLAEKQSLYVIKKSLRYAQRNAVISCSFGIDSIVTLHLIRRVTKNNYKIVFNNSLVEYPDLIKFKNNITELWDLSDKLIETKPVETYWELVDKQGWNFERKGDRRRGKSNSEVCCDKIKHIPMYNQINKFINEGNPMQVNFSGLRASESLAREKAIKRDSLVYLAKNWQSIRSNPISFYSESMVWEYVKKHSVPYCDVYDMKLLYEDVYDNVTSEERGKVLYAPRIGCWSCCVNATGRYYLLWLRKFYPKQYNYMMIQRGLAATLFEKGAKKLGIITDNINISSSKKSNNSSQLSLFDSFEEECNCEEKNNVLSSEEILNKYPIEYMESMIVKRPCKFLA